MPHNVYKNRLISGLFLFFIKDYIKFATPKVKTNKKYDRCPGTDGNPDSAYTAYVSYGSP